MTDANELPDGVENSLEEVFAEVVGMTGFTSLETARLFINYAVMCLQTFSCGGTLAEELGMAADFIADAQPERLEFNTDAKAYWSANIRHPEVA